MSQASSSNLIYHIHKWSTISDADYNQKLVDHLKSGDFFGVEPLSFAVKNVGDSYSAVI